MTRPGLKSGWGAVSRKVNAISVFADEDRSDAYAVVRSAAASMPWMAAAAHPAIRSPAANALVPVPATLAASARSVAAVNESHAFGDMRVRGTGTDRRSIRAAGEWYQEGSQQRCLKQGSHLYSSTTVKVTSAIRSGCRARSKAVMKRAGAIAGRLKKGRNSRADLSGTR